MKIEYEEQPSGKCPVQAEGRINGHPFYFRARGGHWSLEVNPFKSDPVDLCAWTCGSSRWRHVEEYNGVNAHRDVEINDGRKCAAGWAETDECMAFIEHAAGLWAKANGVQE